MSNHAHRRHLRPARHAVTGTTQALACTACSWSTEPVFVPDCDCREADGSHHETLQYNCPECGTNVDSRRGPRSGVVL